MCMFFMSACPLLPVINLIITMFPLHQACVFIELMSHVITHQTAALHQLTNFVTTQMYRNDNYVKFGCIAKMMLF